jgi:hypothetical protein
MNRLLMGSGAGKGCTMGGGAVFDLELSFGAGVMVGATELAADLLSAVGAAASGDAGALVEFTVDLVAVAFGAAEMGAESAAAGAVGSAGFAAARATALGSTLAAGAAAFVGWAVAFAPEALPAAVLAAGLAAVLTAGLAAAFAAALVAFFAVPFAAVFAGLGETAAGVLSWVAPAARLGADFCGLSAAAFVLPLTTFFVAAALPGLPSGLTAAAAPTAGGGVLAEGTFFGAVGWACGLLTEDLLPKGNTVSREFARVGSGSYRQARRQALATLKALTRYRQP